ncbi:O-acetyltransferase epaC [Cladobotryum mycophilum]|uniref:O-acetyltransferase epaC n=1 Tax=Cladobotryum mycophilum TaxID=491253 RepID=A0ABR0T447_9HYPO
MASTLRQLGIFGQLCWDTYTVALLGFTVSQGVTREETVETLDRAALKLLEAFPFLAGQIVRRGRTSTNSGKYEIIPYPPHEGKSPVRHKDCTKLCPSYDRIIKAEAPFALLDGDILCPMKGLGYAYDESTEQPVLIIQANYVKGGLLLCFAGMHNALDMNSLGYVMRMFAAAGRGEGFDPAFVEAGNQDADTIVPLLRPGEKGLDHQELRRPSTLLSGANDGTEAQGPWQYWRFKADKVVRLKEMASGGPSWVSTNDALTAFLMQRLTAVRVSGGRVASGEHVYCFRAVNGRPALRPTVHEGYLGHLVGIAEIGWTASNLVQGSLAEAAVNVRERTRAVDDHYIRSLATLINKTEDKTTIFYGRNMRPGKDLMISSWAQLHWFSSCDFGRALGTPDFVRRARMTDCPYCGYVLPKTKDGHVDLGVSLIHEDFIGLANDPIWREFAELIG